MTQALSKSPTFAEEDWLGIHHVHFYVEDATFWREWFEFYLDFQSISSTLNHHIHTEVLQHSTIQIRISSPVSANNSVATYLDQHSEGIAEVVFAVKKSSLERSYLKSGTLKSEDKSDEELMPTWGDVKHRFIHISQITDITSIAATKLFTGIDHLVMNVPVGEMWSTAQWYQDWMGLEFGDYFKIQTDYSALRSVVLKSKDNRIQIPINEPSTKNSQIQEFLDHNCGAGIQHLALHTDDIIGTVAKLKKRGLKFLQTDPDILIDQQDIISGKTLLQIFTKPIFAKPTFFLEIIQRQNLAQGFGEGNFKSLFRAIEREQISRDRQNH